MKKKFTVTLQDVTEQDISNAFYDAFNKLGVRAGEKIPADMYNLRQEVIRALFSPKQHELTVDEIHDLFSSGV
jgi:hypothetical protein